MSFVTGDPYLIWGPVCARCWLCGAVQCKIRTVSVSDRSRARVPHVRPFSLISVTCRLSHARHGISSRPAGSTTTSGETHCSASVLVDVVRGGGGAGRPVLPRALGCTCRALGGGGRHHPILCMRYHKFDVKTSTETTRGRARCPRRPRCAEAKRIPDKAPT